MNDEIIILKTSHKFSTVDLAIVFLEIHEFVAESFGKDSHQNLVVKVEPKNGSDHLEAERFIISNADLKFEFEATLYEEDNGAGGMPRLNGYLEAAIKKGEEKLLRIQTYSSYPRELAICFSPQIAEVAGKIAAKLESVLIMRRKAKKAR